LAISFLYQYSAYASLTGVFCKRKRILAASKKIRILKLITLQNGNSVPI
jgi:hypothetical protein